MTATLTVATAIRTVLTRDGDLTAKPAAKDVLAQLGQKGTAEFYAVWPDAVATAYSWQEKAQFVLANWQGLGRIPGRACRAADAAIAAGATTATAMKAPKGVDAIEHRLRVLRDLLGEKAPATVVGVGDVTPPAAPVQQPAAAQSAAQTAAQEPAAAKPDAKVIQAEVDSLAADATIRRKAAADALAEAIRQDKAADAAKKAAAAAREQHTTLTAKADALDSKRASLLALLATLVNVPVPVTPPTPAPVAPQTDVTPVIDPAKGSQPSGPLPVNPNVTAPLAQKDAMRLGKEGLVKLAQQLVADGKLASPIDTTGRGWMAKLASRVAKATENTAADKPAPQTDKAATPPAKLVPTVPGLFVADGKGGYRSATEAEVWAALDAMNTAAAA